MNENAAAGSNNKETAYLNNLAMLAQQEMANVFEALPAEVQKWKYNFETGDYIDADRKDLTRERLDAAVQLGNPDGSGVGMATLQRAIITNSAHNEFGGGEGESKLLDVSRGPKTRVAYSLPGALSRAQVSKLLTGSTESTTYTGTKVKTGGWFASDAKLLFFGKSNGKISFMDFSFTDPFTYLKKPVIALARAVNSNDDSSFNERLADGVMGAVSELAGPFLGDQLFSGALLELKANKDSSGRSIYNPQDSAASIAANITGHIANVFTPGSFDTAGRIIKAARGVVSDSGRSYDLGNEVMSAVGVRASEMDVRQSLGFKAKRFMQDYRDASSLFTGALLSRGTRSEGDVASGYNKANDAIRELSEDFRQTYIGAIRLGVPQKEVISALKANGISDETIKMLQTGKIKPYEASKQAIKKAQESGAKDRIDAYNRTYAATKKY